ncbi:flavodoxin domain-containing protein [Streptomyces sp. XH2]|uniref:flavodoxin domain-containing protein n=1 Tax=Streptomyces sp. XH2 TaxID=3412483 RepID=UPI003C7DDD5A
MRILVGYATAHGSTRTVAERIAGVLARHGHAPDVESLDEAGPPVGYDAAVLGSAVHNGRWLPTGSDFIRRHGTLLASHPVWLYSVGSQGERSGAFGAAAAQRIRVAREQQRSGELRQLRNAVHPRDHHDFAGVVTAEHLPLAGRLAVRAMGGHFGDHRDWTEIDDWAESVARALTSGGGGGSGGEEHPSLG